MQIQVQEVTVETVKKGAGKPYSKAVVVYTANGKNSTKSIMSFANPAVFDAIKDATSGSLWDVDVKKEGEYWNWVGIKAADDAAPASVNAGGYTPRAGKVTGSNYETPEERKLRQLFIIRQSSISNAIELLKANDSTNDGFTVDNVLTAAQQFVDFVYGNGAADLMDEPNDLD